MKATERQVRKEIKKYFHINELVGSTTHRRYGEAAWTLLDYRLLLALLIIREGIGRPITVNRGRMKQRGLRSNAQQIVKNKTRNNQLYLSMHVMGKAVDLGVKGMSAKQVRDWIRENIELFSFPIRLEGGVSWVHIDVRYHEHTNPYTFKI